MNHTRIDNGDATTLRIRGELDALTAPRLRPTLDALVAERRQDVVVDLADLRVIDASGVCALVTLFKRVSATGGRVRFSGLAAQPRVIFSLLHLDTAFGLAE